MDLKSSAFQSGAEIPRNAKACPECGSDEKTGWSEEARAGGLDLPDENFDYDEFVATEFSKEKPIPTMTIETKSTSE